MCKSIPKCFLFFFISKHLFESIGPEHCIDNCLTFVYELHDSDPAGKTLYCSCLSIDRWSCQSFMFIVFSGCNT